MTSAKEYGGIKYLHFDAPMAAVGFLSYYDVLAAAGQGVDITAVPNGAVVLTGPGAGESNFMFWMEGQIEPPPIGKSAAIGIVATTGVIFGASTIDQLAAVQEQYGWDNVLIIMEPVNGWDGQGTKGSPTTPPAVDKTKLYLGIGAAVIGVIGVGYLITKG
jgi:hypothetical protein